MQIVKSLEVDPTLRVLCVCVLSGGSVGRGCFFELAYFHASLEFSGLGEPKNRLLSKICCACAFHVRWDIEFPYFFVRVRTVIGYQIRRATVTDQGQRICSQLIYHFQKKKPEITPLSLLLVLPTTLSNDNFLWKIIIHVSNIAYFDTASDTVFLNHAINSNISSNKGWEKN
jgi:hypothetical protein